MQPPVSRARREQAAWHFIPSHRVEMRRQQNASLDPAAGSEACQQVGPIRKHRLAFHLQPGAPGGGGQKIRHPLLAGVRIIRRQKGGVDAGQRDQLA